MIVLIVALAAVWGPSGARADGDPASDVLVFRNVFLPLELTYGRKYEVLDALLTQSAREGFPIRVALIAAPDDLGTVTSLWHDPTAYSRYSERSCPCRSPDRWRSSCPTGSASGPAGFLRPGPRPAWPTRCRRRLGDRAADRRDHGGRASRRRRGPSPADRRDPRDRPRGRPVRTRRGMARDRTRRAADRRRVDGEPASASTPTAAQGGRMRRWRASGGSRSCSRRSRWASGCSPRRRPSRTGIPAATCCSTRTCSTARTSRSASPAAPARSAARCDAGGRRPGPRRDRRSPRRPRRDHEPVGRAAAIRRVPRFELSDAYAGRLLVVMPNGFGLYWSGHRLAAGRAALAALSVPRSGTVAAVTAATTAAVERLEQLAGVSRAALVAGLAHAGSSAPASITTPAVAGRASRPGPGRRRVDGRSARASSRSC